MFICAGLDASKKQPAASPDQLETQAVDLMTVETPPEPAEAFVSPRHSADAKRETYQAKAKAKAKERHEDAETKAPEESKPKDDQRKDLFTESDVEAGMLS